MDSLAQIDRWPVDHAAAAFIGPGGDVTTHGETERRFPLASLTKLLTAMAVLVAVEEGSVALDDPAGPPGATLADLLAHCSGTAPDSPTAIAPPRTRRGYSNHGYVLAAAHLEQRSGLPWATYLHEAVMVPLAMSSTTVEGSAAAGATADLGDLVRFVTALRRPHLVSAETLALMTTAHEPGLAGILPGYGRHDPNPWGLGPEIRGNKSPHWTGSTNSPSTFGHFGQSGTFLWVDPEHDCALVCLTDRSFDHWAVELWPGFADEVLDVR